MVMGGDEGSREAGGDIVGNVLQPLGGWGRICGFGFWFVLFRTYWIEERSYMSFLLAFTHATENRCNDFFCYCFFICWHFQSV